MNIVSEFVPVAAMSYCRSKHIIYPFSSFFFLLLLLMWYADPGSAADEHRL